MKSLFEERRRIMRIWEAKTKNPDPYMYGQDLAVADIERDDALKELDARRLKTNYHRTRRLTDEEVKEFGDSIEDSWTFFKQKIDPKNEGYNILKYLPVNRERAWGHNCPRNSVKQKTQCSTGFTDVRDTKGEFYCCRKTLIDIIQKMEEITKSERIYPENCFLQIGGEWAKVLYMTRQLPSKLRFSDDRFNSYIIKFQLANSPEAVEFLDSPLAGPRILIYANDGLQYFGTEIDERANLAWESSTWSFP